MYDRSKQIFSCKGSRYCNHIQRSVHEWGLQGIRFYAMCTPSKFFRRFENDWRCENKQLHFHLSFPNSVYNKRSNICQPTKLLVLPFFDTQGSSSGRESRQDLAEWTYQFLFNQINQIEIFNALLLWKSVLASAVAGDPTLLTGFSKNGPKQ